MRQIVVRAVALLITLLAIIPGAAAQPATPAVGTPCPTDSAANRAIVRRWYELINQHDLAGFDAILAPAATHDGPRIVGADGTRQIFAALFAGYSDLRVTVDDVIAAGDRVVVRYTVAGTNDGKYRSEPVTGGATSYTGITLFHLACGRIQQVWSEVDSVQRLRDIGLLPMPTGAALGPPAAASPAAVCASPDNPGAGLGLVTRWYDEALSGHQPAVLAEILADPVTHASGAFPAEPGPVAIINALLTGFPDISYTTDDLIDAGDTIVVLWTATGTNTGAFQGHAATGRAATWTGINIFRIDCGRISAIWTELDAYGRMEQLGLLPDAELATPAAE